VKIFLAISFLFTQLVLFGQSKTIAINFAANGMAIDQLSNAYVYGDEVLVKYNSQGEVSGRYSQKSLGNIHSIDAANPMKLLVYYQDFNQLVFLDSKLGERGEVIHLTDMGFEQSVAACQSYNNGYWVYDRLAFQLIRIDQQGNVSHRSANLVQALGYSPDPIQMVEYQEKVYVNDTTRGVLVFDMFGGYIKTIPIKQIVKLQPSNKSMYYKLDDGLYQFDFITLNSKRIGTFGGEITDFMVHHKKLVVLKGNLLEVYLDINQLK